MTIGNKPCIQHTPQRVELPCALGRHASSLRRVIACVDVYVHTYTFKVTHIKYTYTKVPQLKLNNVHTYTFKVTRICALHAMVGGEGG